MSIRNAVSLIFFQDPFLSMTGIFNKMIGQDTRVKLNKKEELLLILLISIILYIV